MTKPSAMDPITYAELDDLDDFITSDISAGRSKRLQWSELKTGIGTLPALAGIEINPKAAPYLAKGNGQISLNNCSMTAGSPVLTLNTALFPAQSKPRFSPADVGKSIAVYDAGPNTQDVLNTGFFFRQPLSTTIIGYISPTQVTLGLNAVVSVTNSQRVVWGTDDTVALQSALNAVADAGGGTLILPPGRFLCQGLTLPTSTVGITWFGILATRSYNNIIIRGQGRYTSTLENWNIDTPTRALIYVGANAASKTNAITYGGGIYGDSGNGPVIGLEFADLGLWQCKATTEARWLIYAGGEMDGANIHDLYGSGGSYEGIIPGIRSKVYRCFIENQGQGGPGYGGLVSGINANAEGSDVYDNYVLNCGQGYETGGTNINLYRNVAEGCYLAFNIGSTGAGIHDVTIDSNYSIDCTVVMTGVNSIGTMRNVRFNNNICRNGNFLLRGGIDVNNVTGNEGYSAVPHGLSECIGNIFYYGLSAVDKTIAFGGSKGEFAQSCESIVVANNKVVFENPANCPTVTSKIGDIGWRPTIAYIAHSGFNDQDYISPVVDNGFFYKCTVSGTSGATQPVWPVIVGNTIADGTCTWRCEGVHPTITISGLSFSGPSGFVHDIANPPFTFAGNGKYFLNSGIVANFSWCRSSSSANITRNYDDYPNGDYKGQANENFRIPAMSTYSDMERWFTPQISSLTQNLPWSGYARAGTIFRRTIPVVGRKSWTVIRSGYISRPFRLSTDPGGNYAAFEYVQPVVDNGHYYYVTIGGAQGAEPTWPTGAGSTVTSGAVTFQEAGTSALVLDRDEVTSIKAMGAVGDVSTDDTVAIQAALDIGGDIYIPPVAQGLYYRVTAPLVITRPVRLFGAGMYSQIIGAFSSATADVIKIIPNATLQKAYYSLENMLIGMSGTGRHGVHVDLTTVANPGLFGFAVDKVYIDVGLTNGYSFKLTNPTIQDGFFISTIQRCFILSGIFMERCGDSVIISKNSFSVGKTGIELSFATGAAQCVIEQNNMTSAGGAILLHNGVQTKILRNQIEQIPVHTGADVACITLKGDTAQIGSCEIRGNNINTLGNVTYCIDVQAASDTIISENDMVASAAHIRVGASALRTIIAPTKNRFQDLSYANVAMNVTNTGGETAGPWFVPALLNSWTQYDSVNYPLRYSKNDSGIVTLEGAINAGTITTGTPILNLPAGFKPYFKNLRLAMTAFDGGGASGVGHVLLSSGGQLQFIAGNSTTIFLSIVFRAEG